MPLKPTKIHDRYPLTPNNLNFTFQTFLKTWIYIILKERNLYPSTSFELRSSFNLSVPWNRHPEVNEWCDSLIDDVLNSVVFDKISIIHLIIYEDDIDSRVIERYGLNIKEFYHVDKQIDSNREFHEDEGLSWNGVNDELRANLYSLLSKIRKLDRIEDGQNVKFTVTCETADGGRIGTNWVLDDDNCYDSSSPDQPRSIFPLRVIDVGPLIIYSSIELYPRSGSQ